MIKVSYRNVTKNVCEIDFINMDENTALATYVEYTFLKDSEEFQLTSYGGFHYKMFKEGSINPDDYLEINFNISKNKLLDIMKKVVKLEPEKSYGIDNFYP